MYILWLGQASTNITPHLIPQSFKHILFRSRLNFDIDDHGIPCELSLNSLGSVLHDGRDRRNEIIPPEVSPVSAVTRSAQSAIPTAVVIQRICDGARSETCIIGQNAGTATATFHVGRACYRDCGRPVDQCFRRKTTVKILKCEVVRVFDAAARA